MSSGDERRRDAERKRETRQKSRVVEIPRCQDRRRRARLEKNDEAWLRWYFGPESECEAPFTYAFTKQQREIIAAIGRAMVHGGDQSLAASRGEGKTTICERLVLKYVLQGAVSFAVLFGATGDAAGDSLAEIKSAIETNDALCADYPEVCVPVRALENTPNRAHYQLVKGHRHDDLRRKFDDHCSRFSWCGKQIYLPNVPGSPAAGGIIATRGLDGAVRGLKKKGRRPTVAIIDDPDTEATAESEQQSQKLEARIEKAIGGLGTQTRAIARVMVTTLQNRRCVSYKYTDPQQKPSWQGRRFRFLVKSPARQDLWDEYVQMRIADQQDGDPFARRAHAFYLSHRKQMDRGAKVANPNRYDADLLEDGTQLEVSALQHYFNEVARLGQDAVDTEYNNDPPEEAGPVESGLSARRIQKQVSGYGRHVIPPGCELITQGIDCRKVALHWVVRAWRLEPFGGYTIDYGVEEVHGTTVGSDEGVDAALQRAIRSRWMQFQEEEWIKPDGEIIEELDSLTLVDAGWRTQAVYQVCQELGLGIMPAMGFGKSNGTVGANFSDVQKRTRERKPGDGWFLSKKGKVWLVCMDADRWKAWEHDRWLTAPAHAGALLMFGEPSENPDRFSFDEKAHFAYSRHIVAEVETEDLIRGVLRRHWKVKSKNNHWLDGSYMADVAAAMKGFAYKTAGGAMPRVTAVTGRGKARPTLADLRKAS